METNTTNSSLVNITGHVGSTYDPSNVMQPLNMMTMVIYSLAFVLGVVGNGLVIWVTGFKMKKSAITVWFLNLAMADFLFTAFLPFKVVSMAMSFHWPFGKFMCKMTNTVTFLNMYASLYILVVISVDTLVSVVFPIWTQNHRSTRKASYVSLAVWVLAVIISMPEFIFRDTVALKSNKDIIKCVNTYTLYNYDNLSVDKLGVMRHQIIGFTRFFLGFVIPFIIILSCYAVIIHRLRRNRSPARRSSRPFKIIAAVIITFFLCWAPIHTFALLEMLFHTTYKPSPSFNKGIYIALPITSSLAFINSTLNPLLYVFISHNFKDVLNKSILKILENAFQDNYSNPNSNTQGLKMTNVQPV